MRIFGLAFSALATFALGAQGTANAQEAAGPAPQPCHKYQELAAALGKRYGEAPVSLGLQNNGHALQVFASSEGDSWTVLSIAPDGTGCIVAAGHHWQSRKAGPTDPAA